MVELTVRQGPEPETFEFLSRSGPEPPVPHSQAVFAALARSARQALENLTRAVSPPPWQNPDQDLIAARTRELAQALRALMPAGVRQLLDGLEGRTLVLINRTDLPWELALPPGTPVRLTGAELEPELTDQPRRALLVVDPEELIPGALEAADRFEEALLGCSVERLQGAQASLGALRRNFRQFGLVVFWAYAQDRSLRLSDGLLDRRELSRMRAPEAPRLVVVMPVQKGMGRWLDLFCEAGVASVLSAAWTLDPRSELLPRVWSRFNEGVPLEQALRPPLFLEGRSLTADQLRPCRLLQPATVDAPLAPAFILKVMEGPQAGREIPLFTQMLQPGRPLFVGRPGPRPNDIDLEDPKLANQALRLEVQGASLLLTNLSPDRDKVRVNELATTSALLEGGEEIAVGGSLLRLERAGAVSPPGSPEASRRYAVRVIEGLSEDLQARLVLDLKVSVVGRLPECALTLRDPAVSRQHVSFIARDGAYYLSPVGNRPTVLNGVELEAEKELRPGDRITLSPTTTLEFIEC